MAGTGRSTELNRASRSCLDRFYRAFVQRFNPAGHAAAWLQDMDARVPPAQRSVPQEQMMLPIINGGKDVALMKKMVGAWGEAAVAELIAEFFRTQDFRVVSSGYDVTALYMNAQRLMLRMRGTVVPDRRTAANVDAASRAMRPK